MVTGLLTLLCLLDVGLLAAVIIVMRRREHGNADILSEVTEERRLLQEQQRSVQEDLEAMQERGREIMDRLSLLATEAEQEVRSGRDALGRELEKMMAPLANRFEQPLRELAQRQAALEHLSRELEQKRALLQKTVSRGESIFKFFNERVPYEQVLQEIQDKKYSDARSLLAQGLDPARVACELGMTESEVRLVHGVSARQ